MEKRCVLLVTDHPQESEIITSVLEDERINVIGASTGREALDVLMGVENVPAFGRIVPDVIIIRNQLTDMSAFEVYNVLSNYFRFSNVEYYLLNDINDNVFVPPYSSSIFESRLERPVTPDSIAYNQLLDLKRKLLNTRRAMLIPFLGLVERKTALVFTKTGVVAAFKAAACIAGVALLGVGLAAMQPDAQTSLNHVQQPETATYVPSAPVTLQTEEAQLITSSMEENQAEVISEVNVQPNAPAEEQSAVMSDTTRATVAARDAADSAPSKKTFSIGVR